MKKIMSKIFVVFSSVIVLSCSGDDFKVSPVYHEITGTYNLVELTSNYPVDYNADGKYETNLFPFVSQQSCVSSIELSENRQVIWNSLQFFGGVGVVMGSDCMLAPNSQIPNTCRINDGVHGSNPEKYTLIRYENNQLELVNSFNKHFTWKLVNDKITITREEPLLLAYQFEGREYPSGFGCSPGNGIFLTYTFQKQ